MRSFWQDNCFKTLLGINALVRDIRTEQTLKTKKPYWKIITVWDFSSNHCWRNESWNIYFSKLFWHCLEIILKLRFLCCWPWQISRMVFQNTIISVDEAEMNQLKSSLEMTKPCFKSLFWRYRYKCVTKKASGLRYT